MPALAVGVFTKLRCSMQTCQTASGKAQINYSHTEQNWGVKVTVFNVGAHQGGINSRVTAPTRFTGAPIHFQVYELS